MDLVIHLYVETSRGLLRSGALDSHYQVNSDLFHGPGNWTVNLDLIMDIM